MKRMGSKLRKLKEKMKEQLLSDGKCLSGKNHLTDSRIDKIQNYYGLDFRRNLNSVHAMLQDILVIFMHKLSNDENPQHGFCPIGEDSWSGFKKAEATGSAYKNKHNRPLAVVEAMSAVFKDLFHPNLLKKCVHANTQNPNKSVNNVIWSRVTKATFAQIKALTLGHILNSLSSSDEFYDSDCIRCGTKNTIKNHDSSLTSQMKSVCSTGL
ncbi:hypothetical protein AVEN_19022-1 [Araneus ventricosus]|uniref:Uncharacterized protein n=1 Tax=Araneus ventricosus TaxID=182803 RepID=A0A4Y2KJ38_ARAVE|nr:hypothetical protein AVEN_19022-1 [Araneus ventricosus]